VNNAEAVRIIREAIPGVVAIYRFGSTVQRPTQAGH